MKNGTPAAIVIPAAGLSLTLVNVLFVDPYKEGLGKEDK